MCYHPAFKELSESIINNPDRYEAHDKAKSVVEQLCQDRDILHETLSRCLANPAVLQEAKNLSIPLVMKGDVMIILNLFVPVRDGARNICHDNIHHHGWRLLTTGIVSGKGYETINFRRGSHLNRSGDKVDLEVEEIFHHVAGNVRFINSNQAHVVFNPTSLCSTLAVWSADSIRINQGIKRHLENFPVVRKIAVKAIHASGLNNILGLNPLNGLYYHPEGGIMLETKNYSKPFDGSREEILGCMFKFFQQVDFNDADYWRDRQKNAPPEALSLIEKLIAGESIPDTGIWGNYRRRFSKTQMLQALDHAFPSDAS